MLFKSIIPSPKWISWPERGPEGLPAADLRGHSAFREGPRPQTTSEFPAFRGIAHANGNNETTHAIKLHNFEYLPEKKRKSPLMSLWRLSMRSRGRQNPQRAAELSVHPSSKSPVCPSAKKFKSFTFISFSIYCRSIVLSWAAEAPLVGLGGGGSDCSSLGATSAKIEKVSFIFSLFLAFNDS